VTERLLHWTGEKLLANEDGTKLALHTRFLCPAMVLVWCDESTRYETPSNWIADVAEWDALAVDYDIAGHIQQPIPASGTPIGGTLPIKFAFSTCVRADTVPSSTLGLAQLQSAAAAAYAALGADPDNIHLIVDNSGSMTYADTMNKNGEFDAFEAWLQAQWPQATIDRRIFFSATEPWVQYATEWLKDA